MSKKYFYFLLSFFFLTQANAQKEKDSLVFGIHFKWKTENLELRKNYISNHDTLQLTEFKFYISNTEISYADGTYFKEDNSYHLVNIEKVNSHYIFLAPKSEKIISKVVFNLGIDSVFSVSGALSGDLDVQNGMYWAWQSGYINMKIEGISKSCKTRKNQFQFHLGGYLKPYYALRKIILYPNQKYIYINVDVSKWFNTINLSEINSVMIPGKQAMQLSDQIVTMFEAR